MDDKGNGWGEWKNHVLLELSRMNDKIEKSDGKRLEYEVKSTEQRNKMSNQITAIKVKSGVWGAIAGLIPVSVLFMWLYIKNTP